VSCGTYKEVMFAVVTFYDYRKEVKIDCLGYSHNIESARKALFHNAVDTYRKRYNSSSKTYKSRFVILKKIDQTEYVTLNGELCQYQAVIISSKEVMTKHRFCEFLLRKDTFNIDDNDDQDLTQEWLNDNMAVIADNLFEFGYEEETDDGEIGFDRFSTVYGIVKIEEV
jgi:hypothetical protein